MTIYIKVIDQRRLQKGRHFFYANYQTFNFFRIFAARFKLLRLINGDDVKTQKIVVK